MSEQWLAAQDGEKKYWQRPGVIWAEHDKFLGYGHYMRMWQDYGIEDFELDMKGQSVLDVGCGPASVLMRMVNASKLTGVDPLEYGAAARRRYAAFNIDYRVANAENLDALNLQVYDLALMYNLLQHPENPAKIVEQVRKYAREIRVYEWLQVPIDREHLWTLTPELLDSWFEGCKVKYKTVTRVVDQYSNCDAYAAIFEP